MKTSKWGSLLQGAVANLESRLDTILAEDGASGKPPSTPVPVPKEKPLTFEQIKNASRARKELGAETAGSARKSIDSQRSASQRASLDSQRPTKTIVSEVQIEDVEGKVSDETDSKPLSEDPDLAQETMPRISTDSVRSAVTLSEQDEDTAPTSVTASSITPSVAEIQAQLEQLRADNEAQELQRQEEVHTYLEKIDALQRRVQSLAAESVAKAQSAAEDAPADSPQAKLAAKEQQIAELLEEGKKLSESEVTKSTTIKKLRQKIVDEGRALADLRRKLAAAEKSIAEKSDSATRLESAAREANAKLTRLTRAEREVEELKKARDARDSTIEFLKQQLNDAVSKMKEEEREATAKALEAEKKVSQSLLDDLQSAKLEKQLAEDKHKTSLKALEEERERLRERHAAQEATMRNEISILEGRLEVLRERSEEASSATIGDGQAKLLRQIELLQSQYAQASENWQGIESTLQARLVTVERERDEVSKQESETRKKARESNSASRRLQEELDEAVRKSDVLEAELTERQAAATKLQARASELERSLQEARATHEKEKTAWEATLNARIEEEKLKWRQDIAQELPAPPSIGRVDSPSHSTKRPGLDVPSLYNRRSMSRNASFDIGLPMHNRRSSIMPPRTPDLATTNGFESGHSTPMFNIPETPSIRTQDQDEMFETASSAPRTVNDMISESTAGAGPSVQLVERMSAAVRRLESEKAASKDEMARVVAQRNDARKELMALMKELEMKRAVDAKVAQLEKDCSDVNQRYQTTLEMLGEKSEEVEELRADVADLKKIYRELVESTMK